MGPVVGAVLAVVFVIVWALVTVMRRGQSAHDSEGSSQAREALRQFTDQSLWLQSVPEILSLARGALQVVFGARVVGFESSSEPGRWEASIPGDQSLGDVPVAMRGLFGWLKHNHAIAAKDDLGQARFGAMRNPLRQMMDKYEVDVIMPLVANNQVMAVLGLQLGRKPTSVDRGLMRLFRLQATAACANVRLHVEAAHMVSLAKEVDLASAVELALVPDDKDGSSGDLRWSGYYQAVGEAGSDFWGVYRLSDGRTVVVIGDAIGAGLSGSMVSAVVKSCCDAIFDTDPTRIDPSVLLGALNRALYRAQNPIHTSAFALLFDPSKNTLSYSNAGHPFPYYLPREGQRGRAAKLGVLSGSGPLLGDEVSAKYTIREVTLSQGDGFVLFTDGLVKVADAEGKPYGERKMQKVLSANYDATCTNIRRAVLAEIDEYRGERSFGDDAALVVLRYGDVI